MKVALLLFCLLIIIILLINNLIYGFVGFSVGKEKRVGFDRTYTRAFCFDRICRDFLVTCFGKDVLEMKPISGFVVFGEGWVDLREEKELC